MNEQQTNESSPILAISCDAKQVVAIDSDFNPAS